MTLQRECWCAGPSQRVLIVRITGGGGGQKMTKQVSQKGEKVG